MRQHDTKTWRALVWAAVFMMTAAATAATAQGTLPDEEPPAQEEGLEDAAWDGAEEEWDEWEEGEEEPEAEERDLSEPTGDEPLGYICYRDAGEKPITPEAAVWLAKMIDGETWGDPDQDDAEAMLWALVQRTGIWSFKSWELRRMIQAYSQPINPRWTRTGSKCRRYYEDDYEGSIPDRCSERRVDRRQANIDMSWDDTDEIARRAVLDFVAGEIPNPVVGGVGWFAPGTWRSREANGANEEDHMVFLAEISGNVYFTMDENPDTTSWDEWEVTVVGPDSFCPEFVGETETTEEVPE